MSSSKLTSAELQNISYVDRTKVYILTDFVERTVRVKQENLSLWCASAMRENKTVVSISSFDHSRVEKFKKADFVAIQGFEEVTLKDDTLSIRLTKSSKTYRTSRFVIDGKLLDEFYSTPTVTVKEALTSPKKRRISLKGTVDEVYPVCEGGKWKRQDVRLSDGNNNIMLKVWDNQIGTVALTPGDTITVQNVVVGEFCGKTDINTIADTMIEVSKAASSTKKLTIDGIDDIGATVELMDVAGVGYIADRHLIEKLFGGVDELITQLPVTVVVKLNGRSVESVQKSTD